MKRKPKIKPQLSSAAWNFSPVPTKVPEGLSWSIVLDRPPGCLGTVKLKDKDVEWKGYVQFAEDTPDGLSFTFVFVGDAAEIEAFNQAYKKARPFMSKEVTSKVADEID
jgi:hypothetical protein